MVMLFCFGCGTDQNEQREKCREIVGNFDHHLEASVQCGVHCLVRHIPGFTRSHWRCTQSKKMFDNGSWWMPHCTIALCLEEPHNQRDTNNIAGTAVVGSATGDTAKACRFPSTCARSKHIGLALEEWNKGFHLNNPWLTVALFGEAWYFFDNQTLCSVPQKGYRLTVNY